MNERILQNPLLYLSLFFERDKTLYYDNLTRVREKNDLLGWLKYFLVGIEATATQAVDTLREILMLKANVETEIHRELGKRSTSALALLNELFRNPIVTKSAVQKICNLSKMAANNLVNIFEERGILRELTGKPRNQVFYFNRYLSLFE